MKSLTLITLGSRIQINKERNIAAPDKVAQGLHVNWLRSHMSITSVKLVMKTIKIKLVKKIVK